MDHTEAKVAPVVEIQTPKPTTSSNKMHGKSVKNVTVSPDCEIKTSPSSSKEPRKEKHTVDKSQEW